MHDIVICHITFGSLDTSSLLNTLFWVSCDILMGETHSLAGTCLHPSEYLLIPIINCSITVTYCKQENMLTFWVTANYKHTLNDKTNLLSLTELGIWFTMPLACKDCFYLFDLYYWNNQGQKLL